MTHIVRYYMIDGDGDLSTVIPHDARPIYHEMAECLRTGKKKREMIEGIVYTRSLGVIEGGKK